MPVYRFRAHLRVRLQDGSRVQRLQDIAIDAGFEAQARGWLPTIATDICHDAGSRWFDAPPEAVRVLGASRIRPPK
jgi:hypothetical protein